MTIDQTFIYLNNEWIEVDSDQYVNYKGFAYQIYIDEVDNFAFYYLGNNKLYFNNLKNFKKYVELQVFL